MHKALGRIEGDDSLRAVVLRGANGAFCSGLDVKSFNEQPQPSWVPEFPVLWDTVHIQLLASRKVWVAGPERYAINGGAALALAGDLMVCGNDADATRAMAGGVREGRYVGSSGGDAAGALIDNPRSDCTHYPCAEVPSSGKDQSLYSPPRRIASEGQSTH